MSILHFSLTLQVREKEPYEYYDRDVLFTCTYKTLSKIISGKSDPVAAFTLGKLKVDGSIEKALKLKDFVK